jgi:hypothetical protein
MPLHRFHATVATAMAAMLALGAADARAHSFLTVFLAPMSGPEAAAGKAALDGFMVATRERDAHPDETADGHLGGLDVYVTVVDTAPDLAAAVLRVRSAGADILAGLITPAVAAAIRGMSDAVPVGPDSGDGTTTTMDGTSFADAFRAKYGYDVTPAAIIGYRQARRIDRAVRAIGGDVGDRAALAAALHAKSD